MLEALVKKERKFKEKKLTKNAETKLENNFKNKKIKTIIDFDRKECNSIKPIALKANTNIKIISRFSFFLTAIWLSHDLLWAILKGEVSLT